MMILIDDDDNFDEFLDDDFNDIKCDGLLQKVVPEIPPSFPPSQGIRIEETPATADVKVGFLHQISFLGRGNLC